MKKEDKEQVVAELTERLKTSDTLLVADYRGLTMPQIDALRSRLIESGAVRKQTPNRKSSELVAYVRAIGLQKSDEQFISIRGPDGQLFSESRIPSLSTDKAEFFVSTGRRLIRPDWPQGSYEATYSVSNNGAQVLIKTFGMKIDQ